MVEQLAEVPWDCTVLSWAHRVGHSDLETVAPHLVQCAHDITALCESLVAGIAPGDPPRDASLAALLEVLRSTPHIADALGITSSLGDAALDAGLLEIDAQLQADIDAFELDYGIVHNAAMIPQVINPMADVFEACALLLSALRVESSFGEATLVVGYVWIVLVLARYATSINIRGRRGELLNVRREIAGSLGDVNLSWNGQGGMSRFANHLSAMARLTERIRRAI